MHFLFLDPDGEVRSVCAGRRVHHHVRRRQRFEQTGAVQPRERLAYQHLIQKIAFRKQKGAAQDVAAESMIAAKLDAVDAVGGSTLHTGAGFVAAQFQPGAEVDHSAVFGFAPLPEELAAGCPRREFRAGPGIDAIRNPSLTIFDAGGLGSHFCMEVALPVKEGLQVGQVRRDGVRAVAGPQSPALPDPRYAGHHGRALGGTQSARGLQARAHRDSQRKSRPRYSVPVPC